MGARDDDEIPPEVLAQVRAMIRQQILGWADTPVPALENQTPRETCRSEAGRRRVGAMVQSMTPPVPSGPLRQALDFESVRSELLRDLGLVAED